MSRALLLLLSLALLSCPGTGSITRVDGSGKDGPTGPDGPVVDMSIPSSCGNNTKDPGEECDDGNQDNTDSCLSNCKLAYCGDGHVHAAVEACDDGDEDDTHGCTASCALPSCGDGFLQDGEERLR